MSRGCPPCQGERRRKIARTVRKTIAGPGGKTLPLGGVVNVRDLPSRETDASMKTSRALEWKAWLEKPRSMSDTAGQRG